MLTCPFEYVGQNSDMVIYYADRVLEPSSKPVWNIGQVNFPIRLDITSTGGIEKGFRMRLSNAYVVRRKEESPPYQYGAPILSNVSQFTSMDSLEQDEDDHELLNLQPTSADPLVSAVDLTAIAKPEHRSAIASTL